MFHRRCKNGPNFCSGLTDVLTIPEKHLKLKIDPVHCKSTVQRQGAQQIKKENKTKQTFSSSSSKTRGQKTMLNCLRLLHQQTMSESYKIYVSW